MRVDELRPGDEEDTDGEAHREELPDPRELAPRREHDDEHSPAGTEEALVDERRAVPPEGHGEVDDEVEERDHLEAVTPENGLPLREPRRLDDRGDGLARPRAHEDRERADRDREEEEPHRELVRSEEDGGHPLELLGQRQIDRRGVLLALREKTRRPELMPDREGDREDDRNEANDGLPRQRLEHREHPDDGARAQEDALVREVEDDERAAEREGPSKRRLLGRGVDPRQEQEERGKPDEVRDEAVVVREAERERRDEQRAPAAPAEMVGEARRPDEDQHLRRRDDDLQRRRCRDDVREADRDEIEELVRVPEVRDVEPRRVVRRIVEVTKQPDHALVERKVRHRQVPRGERQRRERQTCEHWSKSFEPRLSPHHGRPRPARASSASACDSGGCGA